ncbi:hypothetical protein I302_102482 [Kwoniella bestiolae CBS 10118]|uniref:Uncharacterized protein n=1 Tax=Kwoniella bestiolae CBS 10118 TaxID=1296100 RepID=A0A1B9GFE0_9TREE|nr:hypothetical protein I302_01172 [Kwoniella bestiolae CBS 10118]OCF29661.1 hypothetical protein I302_01172 [Kwoniella bestiolae CBS 10118]
MATHVPAAHLVEQTLRQRAAQASTALPTFASTFGGGPYQRTGPFSTLFRQGAQQQRPQSAFAPGTGTSIPSYYNGTNTNANTNPYYRPAFGFRPPPPTPPSNVWYGLNGRKYNPASGQPPPSWFFNGTNTGTNTGTGWGGTNLGGGVGINNTNTSTNASGFGGNPQLQAFWNSTLPANVPRTANGPSTVGQAFTSYLTKLGNDASTTYTDSHQAIIDKISLRDRISQVIDQKSLAIRSYRQNNFGYGHFDMTALDRAEAERDTLYKRREEVTEEIDSLWEVKEQALKRVIRVGQVEKSWRGGEVGLREAGEISRDLGSTFFGRNGNAFTWSTWDNVLISRSGQRSAINPFLRRNEGLDQPQFQPQGTSFLGTPAGMGNTSYNPFARMFGGSSTPLSAFRRFSL